MLPISFIHAANTYPRPSFGTSTPVPLENRIQTVLDVIPLLLAHLKITHISLACQSSGTIYGFNLLSAYPDLLSPTNPSITFFSPWVHQSISSVSGVVLASKLPNVLLNGWNSIVGFVMNTAQPAFSVSGGAITAVKSVFKSKVLTEEEVNEEERKCMEGLGISSDVRDELDKLMFKHMFAENTAGGNDEARMCMKSTKGTSWYACEDYEECIRNLAMVWEKRVHDGSEKLKVNVVLPEEDDLVGHKGMEYFERCWGHDRCGSGIEVRIVKMKGTDHDTTASPTEDYLPKMLQELRSGTDMS